MLTLLVVAALASGFRAPSLSPPRRERVCVFGGRPKTRKKESGWDREERLAAEAWEKQIQKKQNRQARSSSQRTPPPPPPAEKKTATPPPKEAKRSVVVDVPLLKHRVAFDNAKATFEGSFDELETLPEWRLPEIAFVGRSNVGKSSMLNAIVKKSVAVSGKRPGRTRRINMFRLEDERRGDAASCVLTDLPGYGYAVLGKEEQEQIARFVRRYLDERPQLKLVVLIVDSRRDPDQTDLDVLNELKSRRRPVLLVATKIDKFDTSHALVKRLDELTEAFGQEPLYFSSVTRQGRGDLLGVVNDYLTLGDISSLPEQSGEEDEEPYFEAPYDESLSPQAAEFVLLQEDIPEFDDDDEEIKF